MSIHRVKLFSSLFIITAFQESEVNSHLQVHSPEDSFIELMALGRAKMWNSQNHLQAASLEGLVTELIQVYDAKFQFISIGCFSTCLASSQNIVNYMNNCIIPLSRMVQNLIIALWPDIAIEELESNLELLVFFSEISKLFDNKNDWNIPWMVHYQMSGFFFVLIKNIRWQPPKAKQRAVTYRTL